MFSRPEMLVIHGYVLRMQVVSLGLSGRETRREPYFVHSTALHRASALHESVTRRVPSAKP